MACQVCTLLYCFDPRDRVLLMLRAQEPNLGQWSPCGGKINLHLGESPHAGAQREALEELGIHVELSDLHLTGLVTECDPVGASHWLMFLFEVRVPVPEVPSPHREGRFQFFSKEELPLLPLPATDREQLWPLFWAHRGGFFAARCTSHSPTQREWIVEASSPRHVGTTAH